MSGPGKGRYTAYVPDVSNTNISKRYTRLWSLFNGTAGDRGSLYGATSTGPQMSNATAASEAVKIAKAIFLPSGVQAGDAAIFPGGVDLSYGKAPDLTKVKWDDKVNRLNIAGGAATTFGSPAIPYAPDISSPGPGAPGQVKTDGIDKDTDPKLSVESFKPGYVPGAPGTGTTSPDVTSKNVGLGPLGNTLTMGSSTVKTNTTP